MSLLRPTDPILAEPEGVWGMKYPLRLEKNGVCGMKEGLRLEPGGGFPLEEGRLREPEEAFGWSAVAEAVKNAEKTGRL